MENQLYDNMVQSAQQRQWNVRAWTDLYYWIGGDHRCPAIHRRPSHVWRDRSWVASQQRLVFSGVAWQTALSSDQNWRYVWNDQGQVQCAASDFYNKVAFCIRTLPKLFTFCKAVSCLWFSLSIWHTLCSGSEVLFQSALNVFQGCFLQPWYSNYKQEKLKRKLPADS